MAVGWLEYKVLKTQSSTWIETKTQRSNKRVRMQLKHALTKLVRGREEVAYWIPCRYASPHSPHHPDTLSDDTETTTEPIHTPDSTRRRSVATFPATLSSCSSACTPTTCTRPSKPMTLREVNVWRRRVSLCTHNIVKLTAHVRLLDTITSLEM
jgi:hypothetical protein